MIRCPNRERIMTTSSAKSRKSGNPSIAQLKQCLLGAVETMSVVRTSKDQKLIHKIKKLVSLKEIRAHEADGGERSINLSEEERSSKSHTVSTEQRNEEEKCQRSTRTAENEMLFDSDDYDFSSSSNGELNIKSSADVSDDDERDLPRTPVPLQSNSSASTRIVKKTKTNRPQLCQQSLTKKEEISAKKTLIPSPNIKATTENLEQEPSIPPILTARTLAEIDQEDKQFPTKPPKLSKIPEKKRNSLKELSLPPLLKNLVKREKSLVPLGSILGMEKVTKSDTQAICSETIVISRDQVVKPREPTQLTSIREKQVKQKLDSPPVLGAEEVQQLKNPKHSLKIPRNSKTVKRNSKELHSSSDVVTDLSQDLSHLKVIPAKKKKKLVTKSPTLKATGNDEVDVQESISGEFSGSVKEEEEEYLEMPTLKPISVFIKDESSKYPPSLQEESDSDLFQNSPYPSPPTLETFPMSENIKEEYEDQFACPSPPINLKETLKGDPSPSKISPREKLEEMQESDVESDRRTIKLKCSLSFAGIISQDASLLERGFDSGKFIMLKSDFKTQESPCLWRVDGTDLLQKFVPIPYKNGIAYRNVSSYSSGKATNKGLYVPIDVQFSVQSKSETIVTLDRSNVMLTVDDELMDLLNEEANEMTDAFQTYLQILISQVLHSNFFKEIVEEKDEFFLKSIAKIEGHWILPKRQMLKEVVKLKKHFQEQLEAYPEIDLQCVTSDVDKSCECCGIGNPVRSFKFQSLTYNFDTLDIMDGKIPSTKICQLCLSCTDRVLLYHELFHLRYHLFTCCEAKVEQYDQYDVPTGLKLLFADQDWKITMLRKVVIILAETQQVLNQYLADE